MGWIGYAVFGLVAGAIARLLHPGKDPMNWFWTMLLGIGGAELGGFVAKQAGISTDGGLMSWVAAVGGALVLLIAYNFFTTRNQTALGGPAGTPTSSDYKEAVFNDLSKGPR